MKYTKHTLKDNYIIYTISWIEYLLFHLQFSIIFVIERRYFKKCLGHLELLVSKIGLFKTNVCKIYLSTKKFQQH